MGGGIVSLFYGMVVDRIGRKRALIGAAAFTICAAILQAAAQNIGMFVAARILLGMGMGASTVSGPTYLAETLSPRIRALGLGVFFTFFYVGESREEMRVGWAPFLTGAGGLLSAGVTYKTAHYHSTWAWRLPSALQGVFSLISLLIFPFVPESPRWLIYRDRHEDAIESLALTQADGKRDDPMVLIQYAEITDTIRFEKEAGKTVSPLTMVNTPSSRKRMMLALSVAVCAILSGRPSVEMPGLIPYVKAILTLLTGNNFVSYYLSLMLSNAGIKDATTQLEIVRLGYITCTDCEYDLDELTCPPEHYSQCMVPRHCSPWDLLE